MQILSPRLRATCLAPTLQAAFLETRYHLDGPDGFTLEVGTRSEALAEAHRRHGVTCSAFVTADNPRSTPRSAEENDAAHARLIAELDERKLAWRPGVGQHPDGTWPGERSVLVLGLGRDGAADLGERWGQDAVVWSDEDARPRLLLVR